MSNSSLYRQEILDHARSPRNFGRLSGKYFKGHEANLSCGDEVTIYVREGKRGTHRIISAISFEGRGCLVCMAGASMVTEYMKGKTPASASKFSKDKMLKLFGAPLTPSRQICALLPHEALRSALKWMI